MAQGNGACGDLLDGAVCAVLLRPLPLRLLSVAAGSARGRFVDSADVQPRQTGFGIAQKLPRGDRKSVVYGMRVAVRVDLGGRRIIKKTYRSNSSHHVMLTEVNVRTKK